MQTSALKSPKIIVSIVLLSFLNTSCNKKYDLIADYVILDTPQENIDDTLEVEDVTLVGRMKSEEKGPSVITTN